MFNTLYMIYKKMRGFMGFRYMSESCDIMSTLGTPNFFFFFPVLLLATMMGTSVCIFVRLKGGAVWNKFVLEKNKKIIFSMS